MNHSRSSSRCRTRLCRSHVRQNVGMSPARPRSGEFDLARLRSRDQDELLHRNAFYTVNEIPSR